MASLSLSPEIPDSQDPPSTPTPTHTITTSRDDRIAIRTALQFGIPQPTITQVLGFTRRQIDYTRTHRVTPQKSKTGRKAALCTPQRAALENWLLQSPSHRRIRYAQIPLQLPQLQRFGNDAIHTAMQTIGYVRRTAPRKGFSDNPAVKRERLEFAQTA